MNSDEKLNELRSQLDEFYTWPADYTFKFVVPVDQMESFTPLLKGHAFETRDQKNGKFTTVTAEMNMTSTEDVLELYRAASGIEGVIAIPGT